jgi:hypothetical protein
MGVIWNETDKIQSLFSFISFFFFFNKNQINFWIFYERHKRSNAVFFYGRILLINFHWMSTNLMIYLTENKPYKPYEKKTLIKLNEIDEIFKNTLHKRLSGHPVHQY